MSFQYPLQKIIDLKNNERTQAEWMLSEAMGRLRNEESSLNQLQNEKDNMYLVLLSASQNCTTVSNLQLVQDYIGHIEHQIIKKNGDVQRAQSNVNQKQESLTIKMLDEKVWTKAKEKAYQKFLSLALGKEQSELDEMAAMRHGSQSI